jgi:hypothetical protein
MTYAEFLRQQGADDATITLLDTAIARRAYDAQQAAISAAEQSRDAALDNVRQTREWFNNTQIPEFRGMQNDLIRSQANEARFRTVLKSAVDQGLIELDPSFKLDGDGAAGATTPPAAAATIDTSKFVTMEQLSRVAATEGKAIARMSKMAAEHDRLGLPDVDWEALYDEAVVAKTPLPQYWENKFAVPAARQARSKKISDEHDQKMREEGAKSERERFATEYGSNPDLRNPLPSSNPLTVRKSAGDLRTKNPWDAPGDHSLGEDRVRRVATKLMTQ